MRASDRDNATDAELVQAAKAGDRQAYGCLVDRHLRAVYAVVARIVCDRTTADDLVQDAFLRAYERLELYDMQHAFRNWLLKIATNVALNHLRKRKRERTIRMQLANNERDAANAPLSIPNDAIDWSYWLDKLDDPQRAAIVLFHFQQMPYTEIADVLGTPVNTVRTHLHRGRQKLRTLMTAAMRGDSAAWNIATQNG